MKKLTLASIKDRGDALSREELKLIIGGSGSDPGSGGNHTHIICKFINEDWQCFSENKTWLTAAEACALHTSGGSGDVVEAYWEYSCPF